PRERFCVNCGGALVRRHHEGRIRPLCPRCGWVLFKNPASASAVAILMGNRLVMVRRRLPPCPGAWCLPAGFQEHDESPEETAVREVREETNLEIRLHALHAVYFSTAVRGKNTVVHVYLATATGGSMLPGDDAAAVKAFPLNRLPKRIAFRKQLAVIDYLRKRIRGSRRIQG
ncbi:MAG: NUDIX hydrolase, partial [Candidatus Aureabacteria bacterium]|nr:NUDIX hydrolase [Candidatus Auribacterota bacterium]